VDFSKIPANFLIQSDEQTKKIKKYRGLLALKIKQGFD
jgi:hypothetical protein